MYVARICQDFLANHNINPLDWPPFSPDLWDEMDRRVMGCRIAPATLDQLRRINALMNSMHRRFRTVTDVDELIDFTLTYWGVLLNWFQLHMNY